MREAGLVGVRDHEHGHRFAITPSCSRFVATHELEAGRYQEAARTAERAIVQWRALARPLDQAVALALHARAMQAQAQPAMCRRSAEQALALREAALSANDPQIVRSLDILAGCLIDLGAPTSALRVLDDASARLGDDPADAELAVTLRDTRARVTAVAEPGCRSPAD